MPSPLPPTPTGLRLNHIITLTIFQSQLIKPKLLHLFREVHYFIIFIIYSAHSGIWLLSVGVCGQQLPQSLAASVRKRGQIASGGGGGGGGGKSISEIK